MASWRRGSTLNSYCGAMGPKYCITVGGVTRYAQALLLFHPVWAVVTKPFLSSLTSSPCFSLIVVHRLSRSRKIFTPTIMIIRLLLFTRLLLSAQADPQCYPSTPMTLPVMMSDCIDVLEQVLNEDTAMIPFDLTQQQNAIAFPYLRYSGSCALRIQLLHQNANTTFSLAGATRMATDILRACVITGTGEPGAGGQASVGPTSELMIALGRPNALATTAQNTEPVRANGPHGIPWGR